MLALCADNEATMAKVIAVNFTKFKLMALLKVIFLTHFKTSTTTVGKFIRSSMGSYKS